MTVTAGMVGLALLQADQASALQSSVDFTVSGTSTVRGWTCEVTGSAQVTAGSGAAVRGLADGVQEAALTVPVGDFVCPDEEMTEHLLEALRPDEFPEITFNLRDYAASSQGAMAPPPNMPKLMPRFQTMTKLKNPVNSRQPPCSAIHAISQYLLT